jgi:small conductance mechanosensitive channel
LYTSSTVEDLSDSAEQLQETVKESLDILSQLKDALTGKVYLLIAALIILIVGWYLINIICHIVRRSLDRSKLDDSVSGFIYSFVKIGLRILLFVIVITTLGVNMTSIVAILTSAALAIGLALQGSLANFAGGILLLVMKPFKVGDYINDGNGHEGTVTAIEVIYTRLQTIDNQMIWIPNGVLANSTIKNSTQSGDRLIDFTVGIGYDELLGAADSFQECTKRADAKLYKDKKVQKRLGLG